MASYRDVRGGRVDVGLTSLSYCRATPEVPSGAHIHCRCADRLVDALAGQNIDADALAGILDQPRTEEWTGMTVRAMESPEWMELFVTCSLPSGLIRMLFPQNAKGTLLTEDPYPSLTAAVDKGSVTYLARRVSEKKTPEGDKLWEFGVIGHGPGSDELATKVADAIRTWNRAYRGREATFEIQPLDAPPSSSAPDFSLSTPR